MLDVKHIIFRCASLLNRLHRTKKKRFYDDTSIGTNSFITIKGLVHPRMKISPCFTHPKRRLGVHDFLLSDDSNQIYIKMILSLSRVRMEVGGCFCSTVQK